MKIELLAFGGGEPIVPAAAMRCVVVVFLAWYGHIRLYKASYSSY